jgi:hypothetical protein
MRPLRVHPLMNVDTHLWVLAFLLGFQLALVVRMARALREADDGTVDVVDAAHAVVSAAEVQREWEAGRPTMPRRFEAPAEGPAELVDEHRSSEVQADELTKPPASEP